VKTDDAEHLAKPSCADMYEGIMSWSIIDVNSINYPKSNYPLWIETRSLAIA